jgi:hypothetical protein
MVKPMISHLEEVEIQCQIEKLTIIGIVFDNCENWANLHLANLNIVA